MIIALNHFIDHFSKPKIRDRIFRTGKRRLLEYGDIQMVAMPCREGQYGVEAILGGFPRLWGITLLNGFAYSHSEEARQMVKKLSKQIVAKRPPTFIATLPRFTWKTEWAVSDKAPKARRAMTPPMTSDPEAIARTRASERICRICQSVFNNGKGLHEHIRKDHYDTYQ